MAVPPGWDNPFFGWKLGLDWTGIIKEVNEKIASDQFSWFSLIMMLMLFKGIGASAAGPAPNYDMQKILATRSPREAAMMSGFVSVVLFPVRYLMVVGFAVLGLLYYDRLNLIVAGKIDFEQILPSAINEFVPVGLLGCLLAGLLAAFLGTFAGTLNAAQAYIVNDLYLKYLRPDASNRRTAVVSYVAGVVIVVVSVMLGVFAQDVNSLLQWIVSGLYGGLRGRQHAQMVLVAVQRPRVFLGYARRPGAGPDLPEDLPGYAGPVLLPAAVRVGAGRLHRRAPMPASRRMRRR